jgi:hypothetical protein
MNEEVISSDDFFKPTDDDINLRKVEEELK